MERIIKYSDYILRLNTSKYGTTEEPFYYVHIFDRYEHDSIECLYTRKDINELSDQDIIDMFEEQNYIL